jgi:hypothetical protein
MYPTNLEPMDEEINPRTNIPQPTKVDVKRDIQVLTLNDDGNNHQESINEKQDEIPF